MSRSFFGTNVLVYLFDNRDPAKKIHAQQVFVEESERGRAVLSTQVLQEFYWAVSRKLATPLSEEVAEQRVRDFCELPLVQVNGPMILAAIARSRSQGFSFWDALILEAGLRPYRMIGATTDPESLSPGSIGAGSSSRAPFCGHLTLQPLR